MRIALSAVLLALVAAPSIAETSLLGGRPQVVYELENEKSAHDGADANSVTLYPGIRWKEGWINQFEIMLKYERESEKIDGVSHHTNAQALGFRVRKDVHFTENFGGFLRGMVGRRFEGAASYNYGYVEPALVYAIEPVELYTGYRFVRAIDGSSGHDYNQWRMGPGWEINEHNEVELRWSRAWDAATRARLSDSIEIEYTYKY